MASAGTLPELASACTLFRPISSRKLTSSQLDNCYYRFTCLIFGIRWPTFICQMLVNALTRHLTKSPNIDNVLLAYSAPDFLYQTNDAFLTELKVCGFRLNPNNTTFKPSRTIKFLGFELNGTNMTIAHLPDHVILVHRILQTIRNDKPLTYLRRTAELLAFYFRLYRTGFFLLRPLYDTIHFGQPIFVNWAHLTPQIRHLVPHCLNVLSPHQPTRPTVTLRPLPWDFSRTSQVP